MTIDKTTKEIVGRVEHESIKDIIYRDFSVKTPVSKTIFFINKLIEKNYFKYGENCTRVKQETIARKQNLSINQVKRAISRLKKLGYINVKKIENVNHYWINHEKFEPRSNFNRTSIELRSNQKSGSNECPEQPHSDPLYYDTISLYTSTSKQAYLDTRENEQKNNFVEAPKKELVTVGYPQQKAAASVCTQDKESVSSIQYNNYNPNENLTSQRSYAKASEIFLSKQTVNQQIKKYGKDKVLYAIAGIRYRIKIRKTEYGSNEGILNYLLHVREPFDDLTQYIATQKKMAKRKEHDKQIRERKAIADKQAEVKAKREATELDEKWNALCDSDKQKLLDKAKSEWLSPNPSAFILKSLAKGFLIKQFAETPASEPNYLPPPESKPAIKKPKTFIENALDTTRFNMEFPNGK